MTDVVSYTVIGERRFKQIDWTIEMPPCQHPLGIICHKPGEFDAPSIFGPWGNFCADHILTDTSSHCSVGYHRIPKEKE